MVSSVSEGIKMEHIVKLFDFSANSSELIFGSSNSGTWRMFAWLLSVKLQHHVTVQRYIEQVSGSGGNSNSVPLVTGFRGGHVSVVDSWLTAGCTHLMWGVMVLLGGVSSQLWHQLRHWQPHKTKAHILNLTGQINGIPDMFLHLVIMPSVVIFSWHSNWSCAAN